MWIFTRHRHLSPEALSEYVDGLLAGRQRERASRRINSCATCREELASLRATIALLRELPDVAVPRSFTLASPPPVTAAQSLPWSFRAPSWALAGAASLAGLALAVMVSADAAGLFTATGSSTSMPQRSIAAPALPAADAPLPSAEAMAQQQLESASAPESQAAQALRAAEAPKSDSDPLAAAAAVEPEVTPAPDLDALAFEATTTAPAEGSQDAEGLSPQSAAGPAGANETQAVEGEGYSALGTEDAQPAAGPEEVGPEAVQGPVLEPVLTDEAGTPLVWRALEIAAAAALLVFLFALAWQWRQEPW